MYIEDRLFSETSDEVLYSVAMTEDEYDLFSEFQKEFAGKLEMILAPGAAKVARHIKPPVPPRPRPAIGVAERFKIDVLKRPKATTGSAAAAKLATRKPLKPSPSSGSSFTYQGGGRTWTSTIS